MTVAAEPARSLGSGRSGLLVPVGLTGGACAAADGRLTVRVAVTGLLHSFEHSLACASGHGAAQEQSRPGWQGFSLPGLVHPTRRRKCPA